jgi:hypothetical protein
LYCWELRESSSASGTRLRLLLSLTGTVVHAKIRSSVPINPALGTHHRILFFLLWIFLIGTTSCTLGDFSDAVPPDPDWLRGSRVRNVSVVARYLTEK